MKTKKNVTEIKMKDFTLLRAPSGTCEQCAVQHNPKQPHDVRSLAYQYWFCQKFDRWPDWRDAMAHCDESVKKRWVGALKEKGVDVLAGNV